MCQLSWTVEAHAFNTQHLGGRSRQISKIEASLVYRVSSRTARDIPETLSQKTETDRKRERERERDKQREREI